MPRLSRSELIAELTRELQNDPDISTRAIGRVLRERGIRVGNDRLRATARQVRAGITQGNILDIDRSIFATPRQAQIALLEAIEDAAGHRNVEVNPTHVRIVWTARARVAVYHYGDLISTEDVTVKGVAVYRLEDYKPDLLAARAAHDLTIQAVKQAGDFPDTLIEGIETVILYQDIEVQDADPRGNRNRYGERR